MVIDSHRHFWRYNDGEFGWIANECLRRDFLPDDCTAMDPCVAVEARQTIDETRQLLDFATAHEFIRGVVGWLPIASPEFPTALEEFEGEKKLVALRHVIQDEPDDAFILRPDFIRGVKHLLSRSLAYDILVFERHLPNVVKFVDALPGDARLVLDHFGKPRDFAAWRKLVREVARRENVFCKLSGLVTETGRVDFAPYFDTVLEAFGASRLMFGSDWPVVIARMTYQEWKGAVEEYIRRLSPSEQGAIMSANAMRFYALRGK